MDELKKKSNESGQKDYKERFEFVLTTGENIICQRYFRINNFNPSALNSYELVSAIRKCAAVIDKDLRDKTHAYLEVYAPRIFDSYDEMCDYISKDENFTKMSVGEGLVVKGNTVTDYALTANKTAFPLGYKFDDGEFSENSIEDNKTKYKFAFKVDGREACSIEWEGCYPKFVRDKIDLSNKRGKYDDNSVEHLTFEQYLLYRMVKGKSDLVYGLIKSICYACSYPTANDYTTNVEEMYECWDYDSNRLLYKMI
jgi:hypothetical protein